MTMPKDSFNHSTINLHGSAQMVAEFFYYAVNSILYQRGVYPADSFKRTQKYGTTILVTTDEKATNFLNTLILQVEEWLRLKDLQKLVLIIVNIQTGEILERWRFDVTITDHEDDEMDTSEMSERSDPDTSTKSEKKIRQEIADVFRQITASVTFLPLLEAPCSFDILIYADKSTVRIENGWSETKASYVINSREVQLRPFSTGLHAVDTKVVYKADDA